MLRLSFTVLICSVANLFVQFKNINYSRSSSKFKNVFSTFYSLLVSVGVRISVGNSVGDFTSEYVVRREGKKRGTRHIQSGLGVYRFPPDIN